MHDYDSDTPDYNLTPEQRVALKRARAKFGMGLAIGGLGGAVAVFGAFSNQPWLWGIGGLVALAGFGTRVVATIERNSARLDADAPSASEGEGTPAPSPEERAARAPAKPVPVWLGVAVGAAVLAGLVWVGLGMFGE